ncbi:MAG TPA: hypothetical protein DDY38_03050 [Firmicutes bacterium]|jgi:uncharacterized protein (DUF58 family)|nr:hypothetical protein [Bacillota bacterium]
MIWYVLGLLALTLIINYLVLLFGFTELTYQLALENKDYEIGEEIPVSSLVENNKPLTVSYLKVDEFFPPHFNVAKNTYSLFIMPFQRVRRKYKIFANKRGLFRINEAVLELGDFVGFKSEQKRMALDQEIVVLPKKVELAESIVPLGALGGDVSVRRWIIDDPLMTIGIREYTGNEPQRFIHWPSSAKYGRLMVKKFDFTTDNSVLVILNVETMKPSWKPIEEELIDEAVSLARGVLEEFEELNIPYGLATNAYNEQSGGRGYYYHTGLGAGHLGALLHTLGSIHFRIPGFFENTLREIRRNRGNYSTAVIITPRILETYLEPIDLLARAVPRTVVIAIEDEHLADLSSNIIKYRSKKNA